MISFFAPNSISMIIGETVKEKKIGRVQLQNVQNKTKHVSFRLFDFVTHNNKNNNPHKFFHIYKFEMQTIKMK